MADMDFRKAYEAEVRAAAESKKRSAEYVEWAEQQRQAALSSHAGQVRNTLAFKAEADILVKALKQAQAAMIRTRAASIAGCEEGYGKPEKWADELFSSHGDLTASIKAIDDILDDVSSTKLTGE